LDVSASLPFDEPISLTATVHLPDPAAVAPRAVLVCWPGGSYSRAYWEMQIPGHPGYSFADHMTSQGYVVVAADPLGVGASSKPSDGDRVDLDSMSAASSAFVEQLRRRLAEGAPDLGGPLPSHIPLIGVGHSLGGCLTVVTQARSRCYDAVAVLGFTHGQKDVAVGASVVEPDSDAERLHQAAVDQARAFFGDTWDDVYGLAQREPNHGWLHRPDVPAAVVAADDAEAVRWPRQSYVDALLAGYSAGFAAHVDCSVFLAFGEHDLAAIPHHDVAFYTASDDVTLYVLPDSAHCHNFAANRTQLWDRLGRWASASLKIGPTCS
jgi:alpha-beta hydrolase superfamily lysophospholipase